MVRLFIFHFQLVTTAERLLMHSYEHRHVLCPHSWWSSLRSVLHKQNEKRKDKEILWFLCQNTAEVSGLKIYAWKVPRVVCGGVLPNVYNQLESSHFLLIVFERYVSMSSFCVYLVFSCYFLEQEESLTYRATVTLLSGRDWLQNMLPNYRLEEKQERKTRWQPFVSAWPHSQ